MDITDIAYIIDIAVIKSTADIMSNMDTVDITLHYSYEGAYEYIQSQEYHRHTDVMDVIQNIADVKLHETLFIVKKKIMKLRAGSETGSRLSTMMDLEQMICRHAHSSGVYTLYIKC